LHKAPGYNGSGLFYFLQSVLISGAFFNTHNVSGSRVILGKLLNQEAHSNQCSNFLSQGGEKLIFFGGEKPT
jgi:hypothetical protein